MTIPTKNDSNSRRAHFAKSAADPRVKTWPGIGFRETNSLVAIKSIEAHTHRGEFHCVRKFRFIEFPLNQTRNFEKLTFPFLMSQTLEVTHTPDDLWPRS